jgi:hypothetical protein
MQDTSANGTTPGAAVRAALDMAMARAVGA